MLYQHNSIGIRMEAVNRCLARQKRYYRENYPGMVVENCGIDDLILMMTGGR